MKRCSPARPLGISSLEVRNKKLEETDITESQGDRQSQKQMNMTSYLTDYVIVDSCRSGEMSKMMDFTSKSTFSQASAYKKKAPEFTQTISKADNISSKRTYSRCRYTEVNEGLDLEIKLLAEQIAKIKQECQDLENSNEELLRQKANIEVRKYQKERTRSQKIKHRKRKPET